MSFAESKGCLPASAEIDSSRAVLLLFHVVNVANTVDVGVSVPHELFAGSAGNGLVQCKLWLKMKGLNDRYETKENNLN